jgi:hypothetical protein
VTFASSSVEASTSSERVEGGVEEVGLETLSKRQSRFSIMLKSQVPGNSKILHTDLAQDRWASSLRSTAFARTKTLPEDGAS